MCRLLLLWCCILMGSPWAMAQAPLEFRCENEVFLAQQKQPVQASLAIFVGRTVYDFQLTEPAEVTVYDFARGQITLLMPATKQQLTLATEDLLRVCAAYKTMKAETELFQFCNQPTFTASRDDASIVLTGSCMSYRAQCIAPELTDAEKAYREFCDWSARMNALTPGNLPPFARLDLNRAIAAEKLLPRKIERTIAYTSNGNRRTESSRSEHLFDWKLSAADRSKIEQAQSQLTSFTAIQLQDYLANLK
jgi:hypothetical protein